MMIDDDRRTTTTTTEVKRSSDRYQQPQHLSKKQLSDFGTVPFTLVSQGPPNTRPLQSPSRVLAFLDEDQGDPKSYLPTGFVFLPGTKGSNQGN